ncbi:HDOD domain-containing protein [Marinobacterium stanieri]|jgi:HD-like signal output (HDOD) protein|uniref:HDOD domain-containing protein n=1 Tax=Marinobacterium stanieri TaxID=49186 RepID=A0A1N6SWG2_9GAMM|nr:HDOD domain-containing protein [Marinobacterium stanieri]SIQ45364.1 HDOD domain-containing protein [Marinobacterium stanieri]
MTNVDNFRSLIPPQPEILLKLAELFRHKDPDLKKISALIKQDVALYALILKTINSPFYGLKAPVTSVEHAINLLGTGQVFNLVRLTIMRNTLKKTGRMERFWDTAKDVSDLSLRLHTRMNLKLSRDDIHTLGMLHDCGLPLMVQAFPDFRDTLRKAPCYNAREMEVLQQQVYGFSHYQVGSRMAERWFLPQYIADSIRHQPQLEEVLSDRIKVDERTRDLLALLTLAQDISAEFRYYWRIQPSDLAPRVNLALACLALTDYDYLNIKESLIDALN